MKPATLNTDGKDERTDQVSNVSQKASAECGSVGPYIVRSQPSPLSKPRGTVIPSDGDDRAALTVSRSPRPRVSPSLGVSDRYIVARPSGDSDETPMYVPTGGWAPMTNLHASETFMMMVPVPGSTDTCNNTQSTASDQHTHVDPIQVQAASAAAAAEATAVRGDGPTRP